MNLHRRKSNDRSNQSSSAFLSPRKDRTLAAHEPLPTFYSGAWQTEIYSLLCILSFFGSVKCGAQIE